MEEKILKVGLMGLGTVGTGVYKVMEKQRAEFPHKIGTRMEIKKILVRADEIPSVRARVREDIEVVGNYEDIVNDAEIEIVIEVMGGIDFAKKCILAALNSGKSVVTANKDLVRCMEGSCWTRLPPTAAIFCLKRLWLALFRLFVR